MILTKYLLGMVLWASCVSACTTSGGNAPNGSSCVFPYLLNGQPVFACAPSSPPWCGTTSNYDRDKLFTYCDASSCPIFSPNTNPVGVVRPECPVVGSGGVLTSESCVFPFVYMNQTFKGCTKLDSQDFWCSTTENYDRDHGWGLCSDDCLETSRFIDCGPFSASSVFTYSCPNGTALGAQCTVGCASPFHISVGVPYECQDDGLWHGLGACIDSRTLNYTNTQFNDLVALSLYKLTRGVRHDNIAVDTHLISLRADPGVLPAGIYISPFGLDFGGNYAATILSGRPLVAGLYNSGAGLWAYWNDTHRPTKLVFPPMVFTIFPAMHTGRTTLRATVNLAVTTQVRPVYGGRPPVRFELASSSLLPPNCSLNNLTGQLSCVPTVTGFYSDIVVFAVDGSAQRIFLEPVDLVVTPPLTLTSRTIVYALIVDFGGEFRFDASNISVTGGTGSFVYGTRRALPAGLELDPQTGLITGNAGVMGTFNITVTVTDLLQTIPIALLRVTVVPQKASSSSSHDNTLTTALVAGILATATLILFLVLVFVIRRKREADMEPVSFAAELEWMEMQCHGKIIEPREVPRSSVRVLETIGRGYFGEVVKATINEPGSDYPEYLVAVKTIDRHADAHGLAQFRAEAVIMAQLVHENVVRLIGVCTSGSPLWIIMQFCEHGSLLSFLRQRTGFNALKMAANLSIIGDVAAGMAYIAARGIVHRDLAARNVLVASDYTCKISDFGMSREIADHTYYRVKHDAELPMRWTAPEVLRESRHTTKSDVWSYGVVLFEVMTAGEHPYGNMSDTAVYNQVLAGMRLDRPEGCPTGLYDLMLRCWDDNPLARPSFETLLAEIKTMRRTGRLEKAPSASNTSPVAARARERPSNAGPPLHPSYFNLPSGAAAPTGVVYPLPSGSEHPLHDSNGSSGGSSSPTAMSGSGKSKSPSIPTLLATVLNPLPHTRHVSGPDGSLVESTFARVPSSDPVSVHDEVEPPPRPARSPSAPPSVLALASDSAPPSTHGLPASVPAAIPMSLSPIPAPAAVPSRTHTLLVPAAAASHPAVTGELSPDGSTARPMTPTRLSPPLASEPLPAPSSPPGPASSVPAYNPRPSLPPLTSPLAAVRGGRARGPASPATARASNLSFTPPHPVPSLSPTRTASPPLSGSVEALSRASPVPGPLSLSNGSTHAHPPRMLLEDLGAAMTSTPSPTFGKPATGSPASLQSGAGPRDSGTGRISPLRARPAWRDGALARDETTATPTPLEAVLVTPRSLTQDSFEERSGSAGASLHGPPRSGRAEWGSVRLPGLTGTSSGSGTALLDTVESEI